MREYSQVEIVEKMTAEEFLDLAPEKLAQLIDGVMVMASPASIAHERLQAFLLRLLGVYVEERNLGEVLGPNAAVELSEDQVYSPDVLFISEARRHIVEPMRIRGAPELMVEILSASTSNYDRGSKRRNYDKYGVQELWLIDPYGPTGTAFYQRHQTELAQVKPDKGVIRALAVPGFAIQVNWLWPEAKFIAVRQALKEMETL